MARGGEQPIKNFYNNTKTNGQTTKWQSKSCGSTTSVVGHLSTSQVIYDLYESSNGYVTTSTTSEQPSKSNNN